MSSKPRICLLMDIRNWAFDISASEIQKHLSDSFDFDAKYFIESPILDPNDYDLLHVFAWGSRYHRKFRFPPEKVLREVASQRWIDHKYPPTTKEMVDLFYGDSRTLITLSKQLYELLHPYAPRLFLGPNGFNSYIQSTKVLQKTGEIKVGWAGSQDKMNRNLKGLDDILIPASHGMFELKIASNTPIPEMPDFYSEIDLLCIASRHECEPLTLIEGMALGCFPVCTRVGVVPELVEHKRNGYIVEERSRKAFRNAFLWCQDNLEYIRQTAAGRAEEFRKIRNWKVCAESWRIAYMDAIEYAQMYKSQPDFVYPPDPKVYISPMRRIERAIKPYWRVLFPKSET